MVYFFLLGLTVFTFRFFISSFSFLSFTMSSLPSPPPSPAGLTSSTNQTSQFNHNSSSSSTTLLIPPTSTQLSSVSISHDHSITNSSNIGPIRKKDHPKVNKSVDTYPTQRF